MTGKLLRWIVRFFVRHYYRKVAIEGAEKIPPKGAVLLCANHPNSLFDPVLVGITASREVHFLAKAPLFKMPILGGIMKAMGMIPAYRGRDDQRQVRKNLQTLDAATDILKQERAVGIFPEGLSHDRLGVEMVRSGAARMAFQAIEDSSNGLLVVPIGLNYGDKERFRSDVWVRVGEPINIVDWVGNHDGHIKQLQRQFTAELDQGLKAVAIHLDDPNWESWLFAIDRITSHIELPIPESFPAAPKSLRRRHYLAEQMNQFIGSESERADQIGQAISRLQDDAEKLDVSLDTLCRELADRRTVSNRFGGRFLALALLFVPAILGTILHFVPYCLVRGFSSRLHSKVNRTDVSLYRLLLSIPAYIATYLVLAAALVMFGFWELAIVAIILAPILGIVAFEYWPAMFRLKAELAQKNRIRAGGDDAKKATNHYQEVEKSFEAIMEKSLSASATNV